jgi:hypothetical protein
MSAEAAFATRSWRVGRYRCTLNVPRSRHGAVLYAVIEWEPHVPHHLTRKETAAYRAGRDRALAELSHELGVNAAMVEL